MASGFMKWLVAVAVLCLGVALMLLPPKSWVEARHFPVTRAQSRAGALLDEINATRQALQHQRWADSLSALTLATQVDGLAVGMPDNIPDDGRRENFARAVRQELDAVPNRRSDVVVGLFIQYRSFGDYAPVSSLPQSNYPGPRYFIGERDGMTYCLAVRTISDLGVERRELDRRWLAHYVSWTGEESLRDDRLGPCALVARFGPPSASILRWLQDGALPFFLLPSDPGLGPPPAEYRRRGVFGRGSWYWRDLDLEACTAGRANACRAKFEQFARSARSPGRSWTPYLGQVGFWGSFSEIWWQLGADMERGFGTEAFQAFWTSSEDAPAAFQTAFGVDPGVWMAGWVERRLGASPPGPLPTRSATLPSLLVILALGGIAVGLQRRRSV